MNALQFWTALTSASRHGNETVVQMLLSRGANVNLANKVRLLSREYV